MWCMWVFSVVSSYESGGFGWSSLLLWDFTIEINNGTIFFSDTLIVLKCLDTACVHNEYTCGKEMSQYNHTHVVHVHTYYTYHWMIIFKRIYIPVSPIFTFTQSPTIQLQSSTHSAGLQISCMYIYPWCWGEGTDKLACQIWHCMVWKKHSETFFLSFTRQLYTCLCMQLFLALQGYGLTR